MRHSVCRARRVGLVAVIGQHNVRAPEMKRGMKPAHQSPSMALRSLGIGSTRSPSWLGRLSSSWDVVSRRLSVLRPACGGRVASLRPSVVLGSLRTPNKKKSSPTPSAVSGLLFFCCVKLPLTQHVLSEWERACGAPNKALRARAPVALFVDSPRLLTTSTFADYLAYWRTGPANSAATTLCSCLVAERVCLRRVG